MQRMGEEALQPILYALNVGRGDCFFIEIPSECGTSVVLIDGGDDFAEERVKPFRFVQEKGWKQIDLMILTHIHPDHLTGLLEVAEHIPVREAVLPYPEIPVELGEMKDAKAVQTADMLRMYEQLQELLRRQHSRITLRPPFGERAVWRFGDFVLRHADPVEKEYLPGFRVLERLSSAPISERESLCAAFDKQSNNDSSVWLMEGAEGGQLVLFAGDSLRINLERMLEREAIRPQVFKVGHHGMLDAWNDRLVGTLAPEWILITNHRKEYEIFRDTWGRLAQCSKNGVFVTGSETGTFYLASRLPLTPERVEFV
jgi:beta-lactamase superfamily II metal-dependent hydrolase